MDELLSSRGPPEGVTFTMYEDESVIDIMNSMCRSALLVLDIVRDVENCVICSDGAIFIVSCPVEYEGGIVHVPC